jgi:DNA-binding IclR family transcriptional regulator
MSPITQRILAALVERPRTAAELIELANGSPQHVRHCLATLCEEGLIRKGQPTARVHRMGATPRMWERV